MGFKGLCRFFCHRLFEAFLVVLLILFLPYLPPYTSISEPFSVSPAKPFKGKLALNEKLNDVEIWHKGDVLGPEAFAEYNGELYVSLYGGDVVKLTNNHITPIFKAGKPCKGHYEERICGRPLGMKFDQNGILYVADAYYGIYKVDVETGEKARIISPEEKINGKKPKVPNSIALASNGDIYWSDSSSEFYLDDGVFDLLADPSGRLIHYNAQTKQNTVIIDKIHFANGVALSDNEEFVLVAETARNRIQRYYLKGPKKGTRDIFIDGLPGLPDNLNSDGRGGFFVPLIISADADHPSPFQVIGPFPRLRKFVARVFGITQLLFEWLHQVFPCEFAQKGIHFIGHFSSTGTLFVPKRTTVLHVDKSGNVIDSLHGLNNRISHICDVRIYKDSLYLGSPFNDYIARVPLSKIGWEHLAPERKRRDVPVEKPIPKPTQAPTTTQRATTTTRPPPTTARPSTTPPPKQQTPPPPKQTPPKKQETTTPPPKPTPKKQETTTPPPKPTPKKQETTTPPPKQQTPPVTKQAPPQATQAPPTVKPTQPPPKQTPPTPKQSTQPKQAPRATKQTPSPPTQAPPTSKQTPPPPPKTNPPPPKQQTQPTPKPNPSQAPPASRNPPTQAPPQKQSPPPVAQPIRDQPRSVPVNKV